ncbi:MMPL family transporter [Halobaculum sp. MBLA0143]|uniref:MMPL family transporter n=1 Tax=Halobaculum sp. MBLA0143 TaxID=3079933 RepID=UPI0035254B6A
MSSFDRLVERVTDHSRIAIVVMLLLTAGIGLGASDVSQESSLDQFQTDSVEAEKLDYIEGNFSADQNTTTAQVIVREPNGNVLDKRSLVSQLELQRALRDNETVDDSLVDDTPPVGIANVVATAAIQRDEARDVRELGTEIRELNASVQQRRAALAANRTALRERQAQLEANRTALQERQANLTADRRALANRTDALNATAAQLRGGLTTLRQSPNASVRATFDAVDANTTVELNETDFRTYSRAATALRAARNETATQEAYRLGTRGVLREEYAAVEREGQRLRERGEQLQADAEQLEARGRELQERAEQLEERGEQLQADADRLQSLADELETERAGLENATDATLAEQTAKLRSLNGSEVDELVGTVLAEDGEGGNSVFGFLPTDYDPGSTEARATTILVTQKSDGAAAAPGAASGDLETAQLAIQSLVESRDDPGRYLVFGSGIVSDEITASQEDSLTIVGPLAGLFVLVALVIAYRDLVDILLGLVGIAAVLLWTFGFMGWAGVNFNQIMIAVPVLLIGLSIDYAIHIFMRHREERQAADGAGPRQSMTVALGGVGIALVWVTATTVIGFLSNLTSPVAPIRDFGVVSSFGILAAFLIFGILIPAAKVEADEILERFGFDRQMTAFGTGGGAFSSVLAVGSQAARKAPFVVIGIAVVVTAAGGFGAAQVDTSFSQEDFLAEDPPDWMDELPEELRPGEYTAKSNLEFVNENFVREDSQAQILVESGGGESVTDPAVLSSLETVADRATDKDVTQTLSNGEADIESPLVTMRTVAAENETFNATFTAADTDSDGVPDRNVAGVYDALYEAAPGEAERVIARDDGEYEAVRVVVSVRGGASGGDITEQMRDVADVIDDDGGLVVTATGTAILNKIVQDELLETVVVSLIVTLIAVFLFLMGSYRLTEGSATLGAITLLPVLLSVAWILGTMFLLDIPFNVVTGTITSLTVGLGVAYSIHLSERYNQELDRTREVWTAMDRAVTGTGGALLGSAATTAGGFGVLVFAILPPLQQFGTITAITIVYAFLAAVLVLPSMLVVWTRRAGPEWAASQIGDESEEPDTPETVTAAANGEGATTDGTSAPTAEPAATDAGTTVADDDREAGQTAQPGQFEEGGFVPASVVEGGPTAHRELDDSHVAPGTTVSATVTVENADGRFVLREECADAELSVVETEPEPVDVVQRGTELNVAWDTADGATLEYELRVAEDATDGATVGLDGVLLTDAADREVQGDQSLTVVANLFERIVSAGAVTDADLRLAREQYEADALSDAQFDRIYRAWLREGGDRRELPDGEATADRPSEQPRQGQSQTDGGDDVGTE